MAVTSGYNSDGSKYDVIPETEAAAKPLVAGENTAAVQEAVNTADAANLVPATMTYQEAVSKGLGEEFFQAQAARVFQQRGKQIEQGVITLAEAGFDPTPVYQEQAQQLQEDITEPSQYQLFRQMLLSTPAGQKMRPEDLNDAAADMVVQQKLGQIWEEDVGGWDIAGGMFLIGGVRQHYNISGFVDQISKELDLELNSFAHAIDPAQNFELLNGIYAQLPAEEKIRFIDRIDQWLLDDGLENDSIRLDILSNITTFESGLAPRLETYLDAFVISDAAQGFKAIRNVTQRVANAGNPVNIAKKTGNPQAIEAADELLVTNPQAAQAAGITPMSVADAKNPLLHGETGELLTGAPETVAQAVLDDAEQMSLIMELMTDSMVRGRVVDEVEEQFLIDTALKRLEDSTNTHGPITVERSDTGFILRYGELVGETAAGKPKVRPKQFEYHYQLTDVGKGHADLADVEYRRLGFDSNSRMSGRLNSWFVSTIEMLSNQQGKAVAGLKQAYETAFTGVNGKKLSKDDALEVDRALQIGSREGREYTYAELISGIGPGGQFKLTPDQAASYIKMRSFVSSLYEHQNDILVQAMLSRNGKVASLDEGVEMEVKALDSQDAAWKAWMDRTAASHYIATLDEGINLGGTTYKKGEAIQFARGDLTRDMLDELYAQGYQLVRSSSDNNMFDMSGKSYQWAIMKTERFIDPRAARLINKVPGYMPRARKGAHWFLKVPMKIGIAGADDAALKKAIRTLAWSDTKESLLKYIPRWMEENADLVQKHGLTVDDFKPVFDREMSDMQRMADTVGSMGGGLFTGARKSGDPEDTLPFVGKDELFDYEDGFSTMSRYINHLGRTMPTHLYRLGSEVRLAKMAQAMNIDGATNLSNTISHAAEALENGVISQKQFRMLRDVEDQLHFLNHIPSKGEQAWSNMLQSMGQMMEQFDIPVWNGVRSKFYDGAARNFSPVNMVRSISFTSMLGAFNPAQLIIQGAGTTVAMAVNPVSAVKAIPKTMGWAVLDAAMLNPVAQQKMMKWFRSQGMDDFVDGYEFWVRSGFRDNIANNHADYATVFSGRPYDQNVLMRLLNNNDFFFKQGEMVNARYAVGTAIEWYKAGGRLNRAENAKPITKIDPDDMEAWRQINKRAEQYRLNMGNANKSDFSKSNKFMGAHAIPLQFQQVVHKFYSKVLPTKLGGTTELTKAEKVRLLGFQGVMFGAVGFPLGDWISKQIADMYGEKIEEVSLEKALMYRRGAFAWMMNDYFDLNVDFSTRISLGNDFVTEMFKYAEAGGSSLGFAALGPTGNLVDRGLTAGQMVLETLSLYEHMEESMTVDDIQLIGAVFADGLMDLFSSSRNAKTYIQHLLSGSDSFYKDGVWVFDMESTNTINSVFGALGFQPNEYQDLFHLREQYTEPAAKMQQFGATDAKIIARILNNKLLGQNAVETVGARKFIRAIINKYGPKEGTHLIGEVKKLMYTPQYRQDSMFWKLMTELYTDVEASTQEMHSMNQVFSEEAQDRRTDRD